MAIFDAEFDDAELAEDGEGDPPMYVNDDHRFVDNLADGALRSLVSDVRQIWG